MDFLGRPREALILPQLRCIDQELSRLQPLLEHEHLLSTLRAPALREVCANLGYGPSRTLGDHPGTQLLGKGHSFPLVKRLKYSLNVPLEYGHLRRIWEQFPNAQELDIELRGLRWRGITDVLETGNRIPSSDLEDPSAFGELGGLHQLGAVLGPSSGLGDHENGSVPLTQLRSLRVTFVIDPYISNPLEQEETLQHLCAELTKLFDSRAKWGAVSLVIQAPIAYDIRRTYSVTGAPSLERAPAKYWTAYVEFLAEAQSEAD